MKARSRDAAAGDLFGHAHVTVIEPPRGWRMLDWRELWAYRELLLVLGSRDLQVRYRQAALGAAWAIVRPLGTMLLFTFIFSHIARMPSDGLPYPIFVFAALLPWTFFSAAVAGSGQSLVGSGHLVSKVYFPRLIIPLSSTAAPLADLLVSSGVLLILMLWYGVGWSANLFAVPVLLALLVFAALGVGTLLSALTVAYRDFTHLTPFILQLWMFATPVVFPLSAVPPKWQWLIQLNPMTGIVEGFRSAFLGRPFDLPSLAISALVASVALAVGVAYFEKVERRFADIL